MIQIKDRKQCCGCSACADTCPHGAIDMVPDAMGFLYPRVNSDLCVDCEVCEGVCAFREQNGPSVLTNPGFGPSREQNEPFLPTNSAWAVRFPEFMDRSQSGGLGYALMIKAIREGMVVYGAAMGEDFVVRHVRVTEEKELEPLRLSKYVQSDMRGIPGQVLKDLKAGLKVLFTGTPCQCAGVGSIAGKYRENLILMDIVCHGVPGPEVWKSYLQWQEERNGEKLTGALFRDPQMGWHEHKETLIFGSIRLMSSKYTDLFYRHMILRPSCGACPFASTNRPSDITAADCWGVEKALPGFADDNRGCSLMLVNTPEGELFTSSLECELKPLELESVMQPNLKEPTQLHRLSGKVEREFKRGGFGLISKRHSKQSREYKLEQFIKKVKRHI